MTQIMHPRPPNNSPIPVKTDRECAVVRSRLHKKELLAKGKQGKVYLLEPNKPIIIKQIILGIYKNSDHSHRDFIPLTSRVRYEIQIMKLLKSSGLTPILHHAWKCHGSRHLIHPYHDQQTLNGRYYEVSIPKTVFIEMEYLDGSVTLDEFLKKNELTRSITISLITLLERLNDFYKIYSTDIHGNNIMIHTSTKRAWIIDFGLAWRAFSMDIYPLFDVFSLWDCLRKIRNASIEEHVIDDWFYSYFHTSHHYSSFNKQQLIALLNSQNHSVTKPTHSGGAL